MRQHIEGKIHLLNFDTGEPIIQANFPKEILSQLEQKEKSILNQTKKDNFWELKEKLDYMFLDDEKAKRDILARYGFDGLIKYTIEDRLDIKNKFHTLELSNRLFRMLQPS